MAEGWEYEEDAGREERESGSGLPAFASDPIGILRRRWIWMVLGLAIGIGATAGIVQACARDQALQPCYDHEVVGQRCSPARRDLAGELGRVLQRIRPGFGTRFDPSLRAFRNRIASAISR